VIIRAVELVKGRCLFRRIMCNPPERIICQAFGPLKISVVWHRTPMRIDHSVVYRLSAANNYFFDFLFGVLPLAVKEISFTRRILVSDLVPVDQVALRVGHAPSNGV